MATASVTSMEGGDLEEQEEVLDDPADSDSDRPSSRLSSVSSVSSASEVNADTNAVNPWPYVSKFFKFLRRDGEKLKYHCNLCVPRKKTLSVHSSTRNGLKVHLRAAHPRRLQEFEDLLAVKSGRKLKQRKDY